MRTSIKIIFSIAIVTIFGIHCNYNMAGPQPLFHISMDNVAFGIVDVGETASKEIVVKNIGTGELRLTKFSITGQAKSTFNCDANAMVKLQENETYVFNVNFTPHSGGQKSAILVIVADGISHSVLLMGIGLEDPALVKQDAWIYFKDKPNAAKFLNNPLKMLSDKALERRKQQDIKLDTLDVPIYNSYLQNLKKLKNIKILAKSKWLNAVHIQAKIRDIKAATKEFQFIKKVEYANKALNSNNKKTLINHNLMRRYKFEQITKSIDYGKADAQVKILNTNYLHEKGFTGKGVLMAIMDGGFPNVDKLQCFERLRNNSQILGGYNFVKRNDNFYQGSSHGTHVLSTIAGYIQSEEFSFVGTAPDAGFYLFITENDYREEPLEESLWVEAAEKADSLGVDVINTSLGYTTFDNLSYDHSYSDMDGKTTFISRAAEIAASRGMMVVVAAGNDGINFWQHISAPADAASVLAVGAVDKSRKLAEFSSRGATYDGRIKPDVMAMGLKAIVLKYNLGTAYEINGTSFSSPILAGSVACLRQAFPNVNTSELIAQIKQGSDNYKSPNNDYGYGIPDFEKIYKTMKKLRTTKPALRGITN